MPTNVPTAPSEGMHTLDVQPPVCHMQLLYNEQRYNYAECYPTEFKNGNSYTKLTKAIYYGTQYPVNKIYIKPEYVEKEINRAIRAHLKLFGPKHELKIAGVGYMLAQMASL
jgi:hypothetical protein